MGMTQKLLPPPTHPLFFPTPVGWPMPITDLFGGGTRVFTYREKKHGGHIKHASEKRLHIADRDKEATGPGSLGRGTRRQAPGILVVHPTKWRGRRWTHIAKGAGASGWRAERKLGFVVFASLRHVTAKGGPGNFATPFSLLARIAENAGRQLPRGCARRARGGPIDIDGIGWSHPPGFDGRTAGGWGTVGVLLGGRWSWSWIGERRQTLRKRVERCSREGLSTPATRPRAGASSSG